MANARARLRCHSLGMIRNGSSSKVLLVGGRRVEATEGTPALRPFRIARLRVDGRPAATVTRSHAAERR